MSNNSTNRELFGAVRDHLNTADLSSTEQFDKAILTLSTGGLGLSIVLLKLLIPLNSAGYIWLLMLSWICFASAIVLTVISFMTARAAIRDTRMYAYEYYMEDNDDYANKVSPYSRATYWLNLASGIVFVIAVITTIFFVGSNRPWESNMENQDNSNSSKVEKGYVPPPASTGGKPEKPAETKPAEKEPENSQPSKTEDGS